LKDRRQKMPKIDIIATNKTGAAMTRGTGLYRSGTKITASGSELNEIYLNAEILDISGANSAHVVCPSGGVLTRVYAVLRDGTPGAATELTVTVAGGSTLATLALASGATSGTVASDATLTQSISAGQDISITSDGGASSARPVKVTFVVSRK